MTKEEAIRHIENIKPYVGINTKDALNIAIKALKKEKEKQPTKKGYWIRWYEEKKLDTWTKYIPHCKCSECGTEYDPYSSLFIKVCSNCGAKMETEG